MKRYEYYDSLKHHGIDGQKWGTKNGPPYPLDQQQRSPVERKNNPKSKYDHNEDTLNKHKKIDKEKMEAISKGDIKKVKENFEKYTNDEINDTITRYYLNKKLSDIQNTNNVKMGKKTIDSEKMLDLLNTTVGALGSLVSIAALTGSIYNVAAGNINIKNATRKKFPILQGLPTEIRIPGKNKK